MPYAAIVDDGPSWWTKTAGALLCGGLFCVNTADILAAGGTADASPGHRAPITLRVAFVAAKNMPKVTIATMQKEANRIWAQHAVRLEWLIPSTPTASAADLVSILVSESPACASGVDDRRTLGCFKTRRNATSVPVVMIFPNRASRMLSRWITRFGASAPAGWIEWRSAVLLGRVLAHEIGHYFLGPEHSATGLMREEFDSGDLVLDGMDGTSLTELQQQLLGSKRDDNQVAAR